MQPTCSYRFAGDMLVAAILVHVHFGFFMNSDPPSSIRD